MEGPKNFRRNDPGKLLEALAKQHGGKGSIEAPKTRTVRVRNW